MRIVTPTLVALLAIPSLFGQNFEGAVSVGASRVGKSEIGRVDSTSVTLDSGARAAFRMTLNTGNRTGWELGYAYNRTHLGVTGGESAGMAIHQGFFDYLLYATPEGSRVRPFVAGGLHFANFVPPGASAQYGQGDTNFGINYGAGIKFKVSERWLVRADYRQYNTGKPFDLPGKSGRFLQNEISLGIGFTM
jgi:opacity protein-like surface antigen